MSLTWQHKGAQQTKPTFLPQVKAKGKETVRRNMTNTAAVLARSHSAAAGCQVLGGKTMGSDKASECGWRQQSLPYPLMWLLAVSLTASSPLIYTTAATCNPNKPRQLIMSGRLCQKPISVQSRRSENISHKEVHFSAVHLQTVWSRSPGLLRSSSAMMCVKS